MSIKVSVVIDFFLIKKLLNSQDYFNFDHVCNYFETSFEEELEYNALLLHCSQ